MVLGAGFWHHIGKKIVDPFDPNQVSPASYDVTLGENLIFYRFRGVDYPGLEGRLIFKKDEPTIEFKGDLTYYTVPMIEAGDMFLAETREYFKQPRMISLVFMLKSSVARGFLEHLHAGWGEHGFRGKYTLEFKSHARGLLQPGMPVGQMVAHFTLGWHSYADKKLKHYQNQHGTTPNRNKKTAWVPWWLDEKLYGEWLEENNISSELTPKQTSMIRLAQTRDELYRV